jgi:DNA topoisomerase-1
MTDILRDGQLVERVCPECGRQMVVRRNRATETQFLGCSIWPECQGTRPIPNDIVMRAAGATSLPGFD